MATVKLCSVPVYWVLLLPSCSPPYEACKEAEPAVQQGSQQQQRQQRYAAAAEFEQQLQQRRAQEEAQEQQRQVSGRVSSAQWTSTLNLLLQLHDKFWAVCSHTINFAMLLPLVSKSPI
jgi:hypothetical protein